MTTARRTTAPAPRKSQSCRVCQHLAKPGRVEPGYCAEREDLPFAYSEGHPLRRLPEDRGANCEHFEGWT